MYIAYSVGDALLSYSVWQVGYTLMCSEWLIQAEMLSYRTSYEEYTYMSPTASHSL